METNLQSSIVEFAYFFSDDWNILVGKSRRSQFWKEWVEHNMLKANALNIMFQRFRRTSRLQFGFQFLILL